MVKAFGRLEGIPLFLAFLGQKNLQIYLELSVILSIVGVSHSTRAHRLLMLNWVFVLRLRNFSNLRSSLKADFLVAPNTVP